MGFITNTIQDLLAPGGRQAGEAAQSASEMQRLLGNKLLELQQKILGFVQEADAKGMWDPAKASERFGQAYDRAHVNDRALQTNLQLSNGAKYGDSEPQYLDDRMKARLVQDKAQGMEDARHKALMEKLAAYQSASPAFGQAAQLFGNAGDYGIKAGEIAGDTGERTGAGLGSLFRIFGKYMKGGRSRGGFNFGDTGGIGYDNYG